MKPLYQNPFVAKLVNFALLFAIVTLINEIIIRKDGYRFIFFFDVLIVPLVVKSSIYFIDLLKKRLS